MQGITPISGSINTNFTSGTLLNTVDGNFSTFFLGSVHMTGPSIWGQIIYPLNPPGYYSQVFVAFDILSAKGNPNGQYVIYASGAYSNEKLGAYGAVGTSLEVGSSYSRYNITTVHPIDKIILQGNCDSSTGSIVFKISEVGLI